jgi:carboxyl-terminal processing protease
MNRMTMNIARAAAMGVLTAVLVAGCGGGGGNPGACVSGSPQICQPTSSSPSTPATVPGDSPFPASVQLANICTLDGARRFTRTYLDEVYLWYPEIRVVEASTYTNIGVYFYDLLTQALDSSGQLKDRFSFIVNASDADSITTGANVGYGVRWEITSQGQQRVAFVDVGSPAHAAGLQRGGELVRVITAGRPDWYPNAAAEINFEYRPAPGASTQNVTLRAAAIQEDPVPLVRNLVSPAGTSVAYLLFNAHTQGAQDKLIAALAAVKQSGAREMVLDMRYNQGGYLYTALTLSSMLAGPDVDGKVFERLQFNDKRQALSDSEVMNFAGAVQFGEMQYPQGTPLSRLGLPRVYVLATGSTCSASESVINSLRGVGIEVVLVGQATCGKPYGFSRKDNCGIAYFPIEFQGVNDKGFGDYASGFAPTCAVQDDFDHALGDTAERLLTTALHHIDSGSCGALSATAQPQVRRLEQYRWDGSAPVRRPGKLILSGH